MEKTYNLPGIPDEMKDLCGWMYWIGKKIPRTITKDPVTNKCNHTNLACLASLEEVLERIQHFSCRHGLAFGFLREFGLTYIDLDDCRDPATGALTEFSSSVVERMSSYTEVSISGRGLHIVTRGQVESTRMHTRIRWAGRQIEIKPFGFYMTVSGNHLVGTPRTIEDRQAELSLIYHEVFDPEPRLKKAREKSEERGPKTSTGPDLSACDLSVCRD